MKNKPLIDPEEVDGYITNSKWDNIISIIGVVIAVLALGYFLGHVFIAIIEAVLLLNS